ncbi:MAG: PQQ-like beta-propeller repeat protein [Spirochaetes bacterium]|nr:PQQ-like beta-propeller repeat protein [Spirochaetota bacterium]
MKYIQNSAGRRPSLPPILAVLSLLACLPAGDWTTWGRTPDRNPVSDETNLPSSFHTAFSSNTGYFEAGASRNVKWAAYTGYLSYGTPVVSEGRLLVGTTRYVNIPKYQGDRGSLLCFDESSGRLLWHLSIPRIGASNTFLSEISLGICSSPTIESGRAYFAGYNAEVFCVDMKGLADGNDGPFTNEAELCGGGAPTALDAKDGDILWRFDLEKSTGCKPHDGYSSSPLLVGELLFVNTGIGLTREHLKPSPWSNVPSLIALDKKTGALVGQDGENIGPRIPHGTWCTPALGVISGEAQVLFGGGDGVLYAFDPKPAPGSPALLKKLWSFNLNAWRGAGAKPSEIIASPVAVGNRVYAATGEDWSHRNRPGILVCLEPKGRGDLTAAGPVWAYTNCSQSVSTAAIQGGLLYFADLGGKVHCLDAQTGAPQWVYDTGAAIWQTTLVADGKVFVGNKAGRFYIFAQGRTLNLLSQAGMRKELTGMPIAANRSLYVPTYGIVYAISNR